MSRQFTKRAAKGIVQGTKLYQRAPKNTRRPHSAIVRLPGVQFHFVRNDDKIEKRGTDNVVHSGECTIQKFEFEDKELVPDDEAKKLDVFNPFNSEIPANTMLSVYFWSGVWWVNGGDCSADSTSEDSTGE